MTKIETVGIRKKILYNRQHNILRSENNNTFRIQVGFIYEIYVVFIYLFIRNNS